jgi:hypothetical protein
MKRKAILTIVPAILIAGWLFYSYGGHAVPPGQPALVDLTSQNLSSIENAFDDSSNETRLLLLLSPT